MEIRKILEKELSKSGGRAELVKVPPERRPSKESLDRLNRDVEGLVRMSSWILTEISSMKDNSGKQFCLQKFYRQNLSRA